MNNIEISDKINEIALTLKSFINKDNISLFSGSAGVALFLNFYSKFTNNEEFTVNSISIISDIFDQINHGNLYSTFAGGTAGVGWLIEFLSQNDFIEVDANEIIGELDDYLYSTMVKEMGQNNFDYLHAAGGIALYFLKRKSLSKSEYYINNFIDLLEKSSLRENNSCKWASEMFSGSNKKIDVYNLSMSHGIASIIAILSKVYVREINKEKVYKLLTGAINYVLNNQLDTNNSLSYFPDSVLIDGKKGKETRLAWCYGDLGIAISLWNASKAISDKELEKKSIEILLHASKRRDLKENMVLDAGLCHGTAGIAHIFNRMYINTRISEFKETADYWFNQTLKMAKFIDVLAGFKVFRIKEQVSWINDYEFLEGIAGIGLAMISYVSEIEPTWDECLLLS